MEEGRTLLPVWTLQGIPSVNAHFPYLTSWRAQPPPLSSVTLTAIEEYKYHQILNVDILSV